MSPIFDSGLLIVHTGDDRGSTLQALEPSSLPWIDEWLENIVTPTRVADLSAAGVGQPGSRVPYEFACARGRLPVRPRFKEEGAVPLPGCEDRQDVWATSGREAFHAAVLNAGAHPVWLTNEGDMAVSKKSAQAFEQVTRYSVSDAPVWTHPVLLGRQILIKSDNALALWSLD